MSRMVQRSSDRPIWANAVLMDSAVAWSTVMLLGTDSAFDTCQSWPLIFEHELVNSDVGKSCCEVDT